MGLFGGSILNRTRQLTVPLHPMILVLIVASSFFFTFSRTVIPWRDCYWHIWLLDFLWPMKVSGRIIPTANLATHHLIFMMPLGEHVRKPQVDRKYWVGKRLQRAHSTRKTPGEGGRKIARKATKEPPAAAAKGPIAEVVGKQKNYHFFSRGDL